jgi:hypothetical protein
VTFVASGGSTSNLLTSGFTFYGGYLLVSEDSDGLLSKWYAVPSTTNKIWELRWNNTGDSTADQVLINLRTQKPTNAAFNLS